ncbi:ubiquinol-cytochrome C chaperone family protein [Sphingobium sp. CR28]|uniref:ubiquinol-cytochrome C chaperone family protein n=1 Tax=Sphingobium sp. CR28 TaxID=3400272 RepID=UPI003FF13269
MNILSALFPRKDDRAALRPLYAALVAQARQPHWYEEGAVPDTIDGRFDMLAATVAIALMRLDALDARVESVQLTEIFIEDMDGQIRQIGFGDLVVGKQVGRMMSALGGRLAAYRAALAPEAEPGALGEALVRNLYRGEPPKPQALAHTDAHLRGLHARVAARPLDALLTGEVG